MICRICGYEDNGNFSVCPYCGSSTSSQNQTSSMNQNNQTNSNPSQCQTQFTSPNIQNNQHNIGNQQNNYQNQPNRPVARNFPNYDRNMPDYFRHFGCSFEVNQNELKMSRNLNGGDFTFLLRILSSLLGLLLLAFFFKLSSSQFIDFIHNVDIQIFPFYLIIFFIVLAISFNFMTRSKITVNSTGITVKTACMKYFMPKEKIDSIVCRTVTRSIERSRRFGSSRRYGRTPTDSFYDVFIIMKDKSVCNKTELDTGLCYKNKVHVDYLIDEFNEHLRFL